jgi:hypothetical protein
MKKIDFFKYRPAYQHKGFGEINFTFAGETKIYVVKQEALILYLETIMMIEGLIK